IVIVVVIAIIALARTRRRGRPASVDMGPVAASPVGGPTLDDIADQPVAGFAVPPMVTAVDDEPDAEPGPDTEIGRARAAVDSLARTDPERAAEYLRRLMDEPAGVR